MKTNFNFNLLKFFEWHSWATIDLWTFLGRGSEKNVHLTFLVTKLICESSLNDKLIFLCEIRNVNIVYVDMWNRTHL